MSAPQLCFEVCVESMQGLHAARTAGASRVELCSNLSLGGTTPSAGLVQAACSSGMEVIVLLRPRAGDFVYSEEEYELIARDLCFAKDNGAAGVALGLLTKSGEVESERCGELVRLAAPLAVCFHRAFDFTGDQGAALERLVEIGVQRILTSGGQNDVMAGLGQLARLVAQAGERIEIMPGGGLRADNVQRVLQASAARSIHFSASEFVPSGALHSNPHCSLQSSARPGEFELQRTSEAQIRAIIHASRS